MPPSHTQKQSSRSSRKRGAHLTSQTQRPRTRAWVKEEAQRQRLAEATSRSTHQSDETRQVLTSPIKASAAVGAELLNTDENAAESKQPLEDRVLSPSRAVEESASANQPQSASQLRKPESQHSVVPLWLSGVPSPSTGDLSLRVSTDLAQISYQTEQRSSMDDSSSASRTSGMTVDDDSTVRATGGKKDKKALTWEKLRCRRVSETAVHDEMSDTIRSALAPEPVQVEFKDAKGLHSTLQDFIEECKTLSPDKNVYQAIENLSNKINEWKLSHRLASITNRDFDRDIAHCKSSNEAVIQRTIMISIIDRWQLHELFDFNCEGQWKLKANHLLPTTGKREEVSLPKPDLAIFFKLSALTGTNQFAPCPSDINHCLRPDGGFYRCFPFFFIEVKKAAGDLEPASLANLHSASQALYNIYIWMSRAQQEDLFFGKVRVFTMDLNAKDIHLRMHRAIINNQKRLSFHFDDITSISNYNRDQACQLVRNVLIEYAGKELHNVLQAAFMEVSRQEEICENVGIIQSKRKGDLITDQSSKKSRSRVGSVTPSLPGPAASETASFGASGLSLSANGQ